MYLKLLIIVFAICCVKAYKILVVFPMPAKSLNILGEGIVGHLLNAGHEITYVTVFPIKNLRHKHLRQIDISDNMKIIENDAGINLTFIMTNPDEGFHVKELQELAMNTALMTFENENLLKFLQDTKEHFDAVVIDLYETELYSGLSALYSCPLIWAYSMGTHWQVMRLVDQPTNPAFTSDYCSSNIPPLTFMQRIEELWAHIHWNAIKSFSTKPQEEAAYKRIFGPLCEQRGKTLPDYEELIYNASLILANDHLATNNNPSTPQNFKLVGGYHILTPTKPLPEDLQNLMDKAEYGVIYFSMGSIVKSKNMPKSVSKGLLEMFGQLKQTVLWKYEDDSLDNIPKNVHILKWAPQQSILAHPKCLIFITHGGLLSSTEAIHFGVPTIGIPVFVDQFLNTNKAVTRGYALRVDLSFDLPKNLKPAIEIMLNDNRYKQRAEELSLIYHDRPVAPGKELVHWIEHVVRTRGASHLRSPALHVPFHQKMYLDLFAAAIICIFISKVILKLLLFRKHYARRERKQKIN